MPGKVPGDPDVQLTIAQAVAGDKITGRIFFADIENKSEEYLFVGTERADLVLVYRLSQNDRTPVFVQALPGESVPKGSSLFLIATSW